MLFTLRLVVLGVSALLAVMPVCGQERENKAKLPDTKFENLQPLLEGIKKFSKVTLYEGLPHQHSEPEQLEKELKRAKTVQLHSFSFYAEIVPLKEEDAKKLQELIGNPKSFEKYSGDKFCGGFHPDYLLEWKSGDKVYRMQLCFGCSEMQCFGPKNELLCDISDDALKQLAKILRHYRKNRPKPKSVFDSVEIWAER